MSDGYVQLFHEVLPEFLAGDIVRSLNDDEVLDLVLKIDSEMQSWQFTTRLIEKLKEALP